MFVSSVHDTKRVGDKRAGLTTTTTIYPRRSTKSSCGDFKDGIKTHRSSTLRPQMTRHKHVHRSFTSTLRPQQAHQLSITPGRRHQALNKPYSDWVCVSMKHKGMKPMAQAHKQGDNHQRKCVIYLFSTFLFDLSSKFM